VREWIDPHLQPLAVDVDVEIESQTLRGLVAKRDHLPEFPGGVDVQQRERQLRGIEGLHRQVQHHGAVLADGIEHHRPLALRGHLAHDVDALGFQPLKDGQVH
jgi:hypothetical protein